MSIITQDFITSLDPLNTLPEEKLVKLIAFAAIFIENGKHDKAQISFEL